MITDGALLIKDGVIDQVGPSRRLENLAEARGAVEVSAVGRVVMPGFVDAHTHLLFPPPGAPSGEVEDAVRTIRTGTGNRLQIKTQACLHAMARHGTTTVEAKTGSWPDDNIEIKLLRVLEALKDNPLDLVPTFLFRLPGDGTERAVDSVMDFLPKIQRRRFAHFADLAWEDGGDNPYRQEIFDQYLETARKLRFPAKIHAEHGPASGAIALAIRHMAAVEHLENASPDDAALLARTGTPVTLLPGNGFCNGRSNAPARAFIDAGVPIALGTDFNPQHTPTLSMQTVVVLASLRLGMTPAESLTAATINGAHVLGRADKVGSLEVGKSADLVLLNCPDYRDLIPSFGMNLVHGTMRHGQFIYKEGKVEPQPAHEFSKSPLWE